MTDRPFPPSPRRRALARLAGLHAASPIAAGAAACGAALIAASALAGGAAARLGGWLEAACHGAGAPGAGLALAPSGAPGAGPALAPAAGVPEAGLALAPAAVPEAVLALALPALAAAAIAAAIAHAAQSRALWLPRRRVAGAPAVERGPGARIARAGFELAAGAVIAGCAFGWLWLMAPRLAALPSLPRAGGAMIASAAAAFATAWAVLGVLDALLRHAELARALRMSPRDKREDDRLAGLDPRWRDLRAKARRTSPGEAVAGATLLLLGDDAAVAIAWDPARRPIPTRTAAGRGARATQLLGLARRHRVPVHRDAALATALAAGDGPVPEAHWARLAEVVAAVRRR